MTAVYVRPLIRTVDDWADLTATVALRRITVTGDTTTRVWDVACICGWWDVLPDETEARTVGVDHVCGDTSGAYDRFRRDVALLRGAALASGAVKLGRRCGQ